MVSITQVITMIIIETAVEVVDKIMVKMEEVVDKVVVNSMDKIVDKVEEVIKVVEEVEAEDCL